MSSQIGIAHYKDNFDKENVTELNNLMTELAMNYSKLVNKEAMSNRESDLFEKYAGQYSKDIKSLRAVRDLCNQISDFCTDILFDISYKAVFEKAAILKRTEE